MDQQKLPSSLMGVNRVESYKLVIGVGIVVFVLGALSLSRVTIYFHDTTHTVMEIVVKVAILLVGAATYNKGIRMRDETRSGRSS